MTIEEGVTQVKAVLQKGNKQYARRLALQLAGEYPLTDAPWLLLAELADTPQEALGFLLRAKMMNPANSEIGLSIKTLQQKIKSQVLDSSPAQRHPHILTCPTCKALVTADNLPAHIARVHANQVGASLVSSTGTKPKAGSLNQPSIKSKSRRTRKPSAKKSRKKANSDHEYDALDNAVYFNETSGVAMIKASRKKSGGRR